ncbi:MAG: hypothetical protein PW844_07400 [Pantoea sp.]|nr:hypothetical protein [Pantoea sp.]MDE1186286.1 hypothetical protein [Pantoea sp.]
MSNSALSTKTVPQHLLERHENEWRQMQGREPAPKPVTQPARG